MKVHSMSVLLIVMLVAAVLLSSAAQVVLKLGMTDPGVQLALHAAGAVNIARALLMSSWLWVGMALYVLSLGVWLVVLSRTDVSYAYPFVALGMVVTTLSGRFLLHETLPPLRILGLLVIVSGVALVASSATAHDKTTSPAVGERRP